MTQLLLLGAWYCSRSKHACSILERREPLTGTLDSPGPLQPAAWGLDRVGLRSGSGLLETFPRLERQELHALYLKQSSLPSC